jgi:hypothetical protein
VFGPPLTSAGVLLILWRCRFRARSESKSDSISVQHFYGGEGRGGDSGRVLNAASDVGAC